MKTKLSYSQTQTVGIRLANLVHSTMAWDEALNMDDINSIIKAFRAELKELNGE